MKKSLFIIVIALMLGGSSMAIARWETITPGTDRLWVPSGWLVRTIEERGTRVTNGMGGYLYTAVTGLGVAMTFLPDPTHSWK